MGYRPALALVALLAALTASAGEGAEVAGAVRDGAGAPVAGASVTFVNLETGRRHVALSDDDGVWEMIGLVPGEHLVEVLREGYLKLVPGHVVVAAGSTEGLDFTLERRGARRATPPAESLSVSPPVSPSPAAPPPPATTRRRMERLLPGESPMGRPLAASDPKKAASVLITELGEELGLAVAGAPRLEPASGPPPGWDERLAAAHQALRERRPDEARELYRRLAAEYPAAAEPFQGIAESFLAVGRRAEGLDLLRRIGETLARVGRYGDAVAPLERALELAGEDVGLYAELGRARVELLRYREAIPALERAVELDRVDLQTLLYLAAAHWEAGDLEASEEVFERALEVHGESFEILWRTGQFLLWQGRAEEAVGLLERARAQRGDHPQMLFALARAEAMAGRIEGAVATYQRVLELAPHLGAARHALAILEKRRAAAAPPALPAPPTAVGDIVLTAVTPPGLDFRHDPGVSPERYMPEIMGSGLAWLDYDGDGWQDVYLVQSGVYPPDGGERAANRLYRNLGPGADGQVRFADVTGRSGAGDRSFGFGAVAADIDGDGASDLFLTNYGADVVLRNRGDGTFEDRTATAGVADAGWSSSAAFADADGDGDLDLYVARYIDYVDLRCTNRETGEPDYCDIDLFDGVADLFYLNEGDGAGGRIAFREATAAAGLAAAAPGRGLGVVWLDLDGDAAPDLYVANDLTPNFLWRSNGDGTFEDFSLLSGTALNWEGEVEAGMGVTAGDVDLDGDADLAVTNYDLETNTLYLNLGDLQFDDAATASGFGPPSFNLLGFGIVLADFDRDGDLDAYVANGHVIERPHRKVVDFLEPDLVLAGDGRGRFAEHARIGPPALGRGAAAADYDGDGDLDLMVQNNRAAPALVRNDAARGAWLGVILHGRAPNTEAVGARVTLLVGDRRLRRWVTAGDSYQSSSDRRLLFGWRGGEAPAALEVRWPSGRRSRLERPAPGRYLHLVEP